MIISATLVSALLLGAPAASEPAPEPPPPTVEAGPSCEDGESGCDMRKEEIRALLDESKVYKKAGSASVGIGGSFVVLGIVVTLVGFGLGSPGAAIGGVVVIGLAGSAMIGGGVTYGVGQGKFKRAQRDWDKYKASKQVSVGPGGLVLHF